MKFIEARDIKLGFLLHVDGQMKRVTDIAISDKTNSVAVKFPDGKIAVTKSSAEVLVDEEFHLKSEQTLRTRNSGYLPRLKDE